MSRRAWVAIAAIAAMAISPTGAIAHGGNPDYRSELHGIEPGAPSVEVQMRGFDDRLELRNRGDETVVVQGYDGEPYLRFVPDGTVQVNTRSPAYYLNRDRFGESGVPDAAGENAAPRWTTVAQEGLYSWHDHRTHYMSRGTPSQVTDESERTKVFDYRVPIEVGGRPASVTGTLYWAGEDGGFPVATLLIGLAVAALLGLGVLIMILRRRSAGEQEPGTRTEAW